MAQPHSPIVISSRAQSPHSPELTPSPSSDKLAGAWVTFLTGADASYLPGVLVLDHSLRAVGSQHPLIVGLDRRQPSSSLQILADAGIATFEVETLAPDIAAHCGVAERFIDTFTKLRAWELDHYDRVVLIDSALVDPDRPLIAQAMSLSGAMPTS